MDFKALDLCSKKTQSYGIVFSLWVGHMQLAFLTIMKTYDIAQRFQKLQLKMITVFPRLDALHVSNAAARFDFRSSGRNTF